MASTENGPSVLGKPVRMPEGGERVRGTARYTGDIVVPDMLHGRPVLSTHAHAKIRAVHKQRALEIPGVVAVLTADDLAVKFRAITRAHMLLAQGRVIFYGQPVAVVVAETEQAAEDGAHALQIEYEPLPAAIDVEAALAPDAPLVWPHGVPKEENPDDAAHGQVAAAAKSPLPEKWSNVAGEVNFSRGDVEEGFRQADLILENTYHTQSVHQAYMETNAVVAQPDPILGGLTVYTSTQAQFLVRDKVAQVVGLPVSKVRVITPTVGGAFGGKFGTFDALVAAIAVTVHRPVRMMLSRSEDLLAGTPAPHTVIRIKTGMTKDGRLVAVDAEILLDNGTHPTGLPGLTSLTLGACYTTPNLKIRGVGVLTHKPAVGAYRAPGAPQATFAMESQMDEMACTLGLDPLEVRLKNAVHEGDPLADNRRYPVIGLKACLQRLAAHPLWKQRKREPGVGYGLAIGGWIGSLVPASAACGMDGDGTIRVHVASTDITGTNTSMAQIAAEIFNLPPEKVHLVAGDTQSGVFAGPSGGSMTTRTVGAAVLAAAEAARTKFLETAAAMLEASPNDLVMENGTVKVRGVPAKALSYKEIATRTMSYSSAFPPIVAQGSVALRDIAPPFVVELARVRVDSETGQVRVLDWVVVQDVGYALNPLLIAGQVHGGLVQSQGWALGEALVYDEGGQLRSGTLMDYALPKAEAIPPIAVELVEVPARGSPFGARGVGEPSIITGATAIANAVRDACGVRVTSLPITPEMLWKKLAVGGREA